MSLLVPVLLFFLMGTSLGLLGGGGGILAVPIFLYATHCSPGEARAAALLVTVLTSIVAVLPYVRARRVRFKIGLPFALVSMIGAYAGGRLTRFTSEVALRALLVSVMMVAAVAMIRGRRDRGGETSPPDSLRAAMAAGGIGVLSGMVGVGGGFLIVPALVFLVSVPLREAVGTSLFVIAFQATAGYLGQPLDTLPRGFFAFVGTAILGSLFGSRVHDRVPERPLRIGFAALILLLAGMLALR